MTMTQQLSKQVVPIITRYLRLLVQRNFTEAERELEKIKQGIKPTQWGRGYFNALEGMIISLKSSDSIYLYINKVSINNGTEIDDLQKRFSRLSKDSLQGEFDKGYFTAWVEYLEVFKSNKIEKKPTKIESKSLNNYISQTDKVSIVN